MFITFNFGRIRLQFAMKKSVIGKPHPGKGLRIINTGHKAGVR